MGMGLGAVVAATLLVSAGRTEAQTCRAVVRTNDVGPQGDVFTSQISGPPAINNLGETVFAARVYGPTGGTKMFRYDSAGSGEVVVSTSDPNPDGGGYSTGKSAFSMISSNDSGDIGFLAKLDVGYAAVLFPGGDASAGIVVAQPGDSSCGVGTIKSVEGVSPVNASGDLAYLAQNSDGKIELCVYDKGTGTSSLGASNSDATDTGREICIIRTAAVSDTGALVFVAGSKLACNDPFEEAATGVYGVVTPGSVEAVAEEGDFGPGGSGSYRKLLYKSSGKKSFIIWPKFNSNDDLVFAAKMSNGNQAIFKGSIGGALQEVIAGGAAAPNTAGTLKKFQWVFLDDSDGVGFTASIRKDAARAGLFQLSASSSVTVDNKTTAEGLGSNNVAGLFANGTTLYAATDAGVSISTDGGATFTNTDSGLPSTNVRQVFVDSGAIYAATDGGLALSTDDGATYSAVAGLASTNVLSVFAVGSKLYVGTDAGLDISTDGGTTFTNVTTGEGLGSNTVQAISARKNTIVVGTTGGVSRSTDSGATFTTTTTADGLGGDDVRAILVVSSTIYAATDGGFSTSTDSGASWSNQTTAEGLGSDSTRGVAVAGATLYVATDAGLGFSTDGGASFSNVTAADGLASNTVTGVVFASGAIASTDAGISFLSGLSGSSILLTSDAPPTGDGNFGPDSKYRKFGKTGAAASSDGTQTAVMAQVKDTFAPPKKSAILRCGP